MSEDRAAGPRPPAKTRVPKSAAAQLRSTSGVRRVVAEYTESVKARAAAGETIMCWLCNQPIDMEIDDPYHGEHYEPDHVFPVSTHPQYADDPNNLRPSHRECNTARGTDMEATNLGWTSIDWEALADDEQQPARTSAPRREAEEWSTTEELDPAEVERQQLLDGGW